MLWLKWQRRPDGKWLVSFCSYEILISEAALEGRSFDDIYEIIENKFYEDHNIILDS